MAFPHSCASSRSSVNSLGVPVRGFSLIELMVVVVIVGVLAMIALPSYRQYVLRGHRTDVQAYMSDVATRQQNFLLDRRAYASSITDAPSANGLGLTIPASLSTWYTVTTTPDNSARPPSFVVTAVPTSLQSADSCATLTLDQSGTKTATGTGSCW